jgi:hypothetical protein
MRKIKRLRRKIARMERKMARGKRGLFGKKQDRLARRLAKYQMRLQKWQTRLDLQSGGGSSVGPTPMVSYQPTMSQEQVDDEFDDLTPLPTAPTAGAGLPNWLLPAGLATAALIVLVMARGRGGS